STWPEGRLPTIDELDAAAGGRPLYASRVDVHSALITTAMAHRAALPEQGRDGARVDRAAHDRARQAARDLDPDVRDSAWRAALAAAAARGIAAVHEHSAPGLGTREDLAQMIAETADPRSALPLVVGYRGELVADVDAARELAAAIPGLT